MKTHGVKQQKAAAKKKLQRAIRAAEAKQERKSAKEEQKKATSLAGMRKLVESLGVSESEAAVGAAEAAVETDSPALYGSEPPAV